MKEATLTSSLASARCFSVLLRFMTLRSSWTSHRLLPTLLLGPEGKGGARSLSPPQQQGLSLPLAGWPSPAVYETD